MVFGALCRHPDRGYHFDEYAGDCFGSRVVNLRYRNGCLKHGVFGADLVLGALDEVAVEKVSLETFVPSFGAIQWGAEFDKGSDKVPEVGDGRPAALLSTQDEDSNKRGYAKLVDAMEAGRFPAPAPARRRMEVQESGTEREEVGSVANVFHEHYTAALSQATPAFGEPPATIRFTSEFMDREETEHQVGRACSYGPGIVRRVPCVRGSRKHGACPANGLLSHLLFIEVIENLPLNVMELSAKQRRGVIESAVAKCRLVNGYSPQGVLEPLPTIQARPIVDEMRGTERAEYEEGSEGERNPAQRSDLRARKQQESNEGEGHYGESNGVKWPVEPGDHDQTLPFSASVHVILCRV